MLERFSFCKPRVRCTIAAMHLIVGIFYGIVGTILLIWGDTLSLQYNAWTMRLRARHPNLNPPPTIEWRARNTKIMTILFRTFGFVLILLSVPYVLPYFLRLG
jgi:hypothetical protein